MTLRAPAKLNLCLYLGGRRDDGLHELRSLFCPITLADRIVVTDAEEDAVVCPEVDGPNVAEAALAGLRTRGWRREPVKVEIVRGVNRAVFRPRPRVDSALVRLLRVAEAPPEGVVGMVRASFAHRRKPLANSLELAGSASRADAREALERLGLPADSRAERLAPAQFAALADELGVA